MKYLKRNSLVYSLALLSLLGWHASAFAVVGPPVLVPNEPEANAVVRVEVTAGVCDAFSEDPNDPGAYPQITVSGSHIRILLYALHYDNVELCVFPESVTNSYVLGQYLAGTYSVQVDRIYPSNEEGGTTTETIGELPLVVGGGGTVGPAQLPAMGMIATFVLTLALMLVVLPKLRRKKLAVFGMIVVGSVMSPLHPAEAQEPTPLVDVLLSAAEGAPRPDDVVDYFATPGAVGNPPLESLQVGDPQGAFFYLPFRATGDFLEWMKSNPEDPRAKLERFVVIQYPADVNMADVLEALRSDPNVLSASVKTRVRVHIRQKIHFRE